MRQQENLFTQKKGELTKQQKIDTTVNQKLEKLGELVYEIKNKIVALNSSNREWN